MAVVVVEVAMKRCFGPKCRLVAKNGHGGGEKRVGWWLWCWRVIWRLKKGMAVVKKGGSGEKRAAVVVVVEEGCLGPKNRHGGEKGWWC